MEGKTFAKGMIDEMNTIEIIFVFVWGFTVGLIIGLIVGRYYWPWLDSWIKSRQSDDRL